MKQLITAAQAAILRNFTTRLYTTRDMGRPSLAAGYLAGLDYARTCHYDVPQYQPVFGVIAARIQASGDMQAYRLFCVEHGDELRLEQEADRKWQAQREWAKGPSADEVAARNREQYATDQLQQAINERARQLMGERQTAERARAVADARKELSR